MPPTVDATVRQVMYFAVYAQAHEEVVLTLHSLHQLCVKTVGEMELSAGSTATAGAVYAVHPGSPGGLP